MKLYRRLTTKDGGQIHSRITIDETLPEDPRLDLTEGPRVVINRRKLRAYAEACERILANRPGFIIANPGSGL